VFLFPQISGRIIILLRRGDDYIRQQEQPIITLTGRVEAIVYQSEQTGYTVLELDSGTHLVTVVGELPGVAVGEEVALTGRYQNHPTYGEQFRAQLCERHMPASAAAILKYLSSGVIKGIGPAMARRMVTRFGDETLTIIEKEHGRLAEVYGISAKKAADIYAQYKQIFGIRTAMLYLAGFGIDTSASIRVWKMWGNFTQERLEADPYALAGEEIGLTFEQADGVAAKLGLMPDDPRRLKAGLCHVLSHNLKMGHTCLPEDRLLPTAATLLDTDSGDVSLAGALEETEREGGLIADTFSGRRYFYLPKLYTAETFIAGRISLMIENTPPTPADHTKEIDALEKSLAIRYDDKQKKAVDMALSCQIFILTGGPGTGKTTTLNAILTLLEGQGEKVALAAPTGRAAKRMSEVTGREASTIHRLLEVDFRDPETGKHNFKRDEKNTLPAGVVILDEASMVDTLLLYSLIKAMRLSCRLILLGDPDQLPSVGAGNVLRDLIESDLVPTVHLSQIFRQAQGSLIVRNAHAIVKGEMPDLSDRESDFFFLAKRDYADSAQTVVELCARRLPEAYGFSPIWDIQVIAPSRVGGIGTTELNRLLQEKLNPKDPLKAQYLFGNITYREGDKVMQVKNNYDLTWKRDDGEQGTGVFNGDIGVIEMIDKPSQTLLIRFDDRVAEYSTDKADEIEHAYAVTVHKSQGSEFEAVIIPLMNYHQKLYYRNILYTGVTRAKKLLILLGKKETVGQMTANDRKVLRYTNLKSMMREKREL